MKSTKFCIIGAIAALYGTNANATSPIAMASDISARNIGAIQHSIALGAIDSFEGAAMSALGLRQRIMTNETPAPQPTQTAPAPLHPTYDPSLYGTMPMYGEYGDDGTVFLGRSGGDNSGTLLNNIWFGWQHYGDSVKLSPVQRTDSIYDLFTAGFSGGRTQINGGFSEWGIFGGYIGGTQENNALEMHENGGYVGFYNGYKIRQLGLSFVANAGALNNRVGLPYESTMDKYTNIWLGAAANAKLNLRLSENFTLQPGVYGGYTWVRMPSYASGLGVQIDNDNINLFELSPSIRAISHLGKGWFATLNARYAFNFVSGGDTWVNNAKMPDMDYANFVEYGIGIEKNIDSFNVSLNLGRRDGERRGWNGGMSFKYLF